MFQIDLRLTIGNWKAEGYQLEVDNVVLAYISAIRTVKRRLDIVAVDFLPLGNQQYVIWADGKCQGFLAISEYVPLGGKGIGAYRCLNSG